MVGHDINSHNVLLSVLHVLERVSNETDTNRTATLLRFSSNFSLSCSEIVMENELLDDNETMYPKIAKENNKVYSGEGHSFK